MIPAPPAEEMIDDGMAMGPELGSEFGPEFGPPFEGEMGPSYGPKLGPGGQCGCWRCAGARLCGGCGVGFCRPWIDSAAIFAGVHGFKGPSDQGQGSNFGFQEGFQLAGPAPLGMLHNLGYQVGYQATQSQLSGNLNSDDSRDQQFLTVGLFRHKPCGLQWGVAWDFLNDDYNGDHDVSQIRLQASLLNRYGNEFGFWTALGAGDDTYIANGSTTSDYYETVDQYVFFYRWRFENCGDARLWGGFTDESEGLFGGDLEIPLSDRFAFQASFNYLIPQDDTAPNGTIDESWNLGFNVVWYFGCKARSIHCSPYRPMFNVADNGTMIVRRTQIQQQTPE